MKIIKYFLFEIHESISVCKLQNARNRTTVLEQCSHHVVVAVDIILHAYMWVRGISIYSKDEKNMQET